MRPSGGEERQRRRNSIYISGYSLPANRWPMLGSPGASVLNQVHTQLGRVVREVKLWAKLVEQSSVNIGPNKFLCQEAVKKVMDFLGKGKF